MAIVLVAITTIAIYHISTWRSRLQYPGDIDCIEGTPFAEIALSSTGTNLYSTQPDSFHSAIYGPLYYLVGRTLIDPQHPDITKLRALSLFALLMTCAAISLLTFRVTKNLFACVFAPVIFVSIGYVSMIGINARCDMVAFCLSLWALVVASAFWNRDKLLILSVPLLLASVFYKQQFVAIPISIFTALMWERRFKTGLIFVASLATSTLGLLIVFDKVVYRGNQFLLHFFSYNAALISPIRFVAGLILTIVIFSSWYLMGAEYCRQRPNRLLACFLAVSGIYCLIAISKQGSDYNYYLEPVAALSIPIAGLIAESWNKKKDLAAIASLLILVPFITLGERPTNTDRERAISMQGYMAANFSTGSTVLTNFPAEALRAGMRLPITDLFQCSLLERKDRLPKQLLLNLIENRRFDVIAVDVDLRSSTDVLGNSSVSFSENERELMIRNYREVGSLQLPELLQCGSSDKVFFWSKK